MRNKLPSRAWTTLLLVLLLLVATGGADARTLALLVGIGDYRHPRMPDLEGPPHDIAALASALEQRWGLRPPALRTLTGARATRRAILDALDRLHADSAPGDRLLFYYSGHGTSRFDRQLALPLPHDSGALTAVDSTPLGDTETVMASLIVGRRDLRPRFEALDADGRQLVVIIDACYSAYASRGLHPPAVTPLRPDQLPTRSVTLRIPAGFDPGRYGSGRPPPPAYPYRNVITLAAASPREQAVDIPSALLGAYPTIDGRPHGAFTNALLGALTGALPADRNGDGAVSARELAASIDRTLSRDRFPHRPMLFPNPVEDRAGITSRPLLTDSAPVQPAPAALRVLLDLAPQPDRAALVRTLSRLPDLRLMGTEEDDHDIDRAPPDLVISHSAGYWHIVTGGGDRIGQVADLPSLAARLRQQVWFRRLTWRSAARRPFSLALTQAEPERGRINVVGEPIHLRVRSDRRAWLVLLNIGVDGAITLLYPFTPEETAALPAGRTVQVPNDDSMPAQPPTGTDLVIALAYPYRPDFLDRLPGHAQLLPAGQLMQRIRASIDDDRTPAIATLALLSVAGDESPAAAATTRPPNDAIDPDAGPTD